MAHIFLSNFIRTLETILAKRPKIENHDKLEVIIKSLKHKYETRGDIEFDEEEMAKAIGLKNFTPSGAPSPRTTGPISDNNPNHQL